MAVLFTTLYLSEIELSFGYFKAADGIEPGRSRRKHSIQNSLALHPHLKIIFTWPFSFPAGTRTFTTRPSELEGNVGVNTTMKSWLTKMMRGTKTFDRIPIWPTHIFAKHTIQICFKEEFSFRAMRTSEKNKLSLSGISNLLN